MADLLPTYQYRPKFDPGPEPCILKSFSENRGRLLAGGTFFRSINVGVQANDITVECTYISDVYSGNPMSPIVNDTRTVTARITLTEGVSVETYDAVQVATYLSVEDPPSVFTDMWVWTSSAIPSLRSQLSGSLIVDMPTVDIVGGGDRTTPVPWDSSTDDAAGIEEFSATNLANGVGAPVDPNTVYGTPDEIRTGPIRSLVHIAETEQAQPTGSFIDVGQIKEWNGTLWVVYATGVGGGSGGGGGGGGGGSFLPLAGGTMVGAVILYADPTVSLEAATKQYVDAGDTASITAAGIASAAAISSHAGDLTLHITSAQNTFLDALNLPTLTAAEVNYMAGVTSAVQTQLNSKAASGANTDITSVLLNQAGLVVKGGTAIGLTIKPNETLTLARTLNLITGDADRTLTFSADATIGGTNSGDQTATTVPFTPAGNIAASDVQAALQELDGEKVAKSGDTMTSFLTLHADPTSALHAATKQYVDSVGTGTTTEEVQIATASQAVFTLANPYTVGNNSLKVFVNGVRQVPTAYTETNTTTVTFSVGLTVGDVVQFEVGVFTSGLTGTAGNITVTPAGNISSGNVQAALQELDSEKVAKAGDTMTGLLELSGSPTNVVHAANKHYVDAYSPLTTKGDLYVSTVNRILYSEQFDNAAWTKRGAVAVIVNDAIAPDGTLTADKIENIAANGVDDMYYTSYSSLGGPVNAPTAPSIYIKRITTTGDLTIGHPVNDVLYGRYVINMALLTDKWERIEAGHPAITNTVPWVYTATGSGGFVFFSTTSPPLSFHLWGAQVEDGSAVNGYIPTTSTIAYGSGQRFGVGTNGQILKADSTTPTGLSWSALTGSEVTTALGYTPVNKGGDTMTGALTLTGAAGNQLVVDTDTFVVDATNNRVGIGVATPGAPLSTAIGQVFFGNVDLGGSAVNLFSNVSGTPLIIQHQAVTNGTIIADLLMGNTLASGNVTGFKVSGTVTSGTLSALVQQNGNGNAVFDMLLLGTGDAYSRYGINGGTNWSTGLDNSDGDSFKISNASVLGTADYLTLLTTGNVGIGTTAPTATLHIKAGTAAASTAPLKLTSGALNTTPEVGAIEFLNDAYYATITTGAARKTFAFLESPVFVTPALGTPSSGDATNLTGTAAGLTAGNVTTNANLTGHVTSVGNATVLGSFTVAQLNTAISDADVATGGGTATGTNTGDQTATTVSNTPAGNIAATTVQAAINELDGEKVAKAGDTMTGALTLNADPTNNLHASTKQYVDSTALIWALIFG